jgi:hypothetical protein
MLSSCLTVNRLRPHYKEQPVNALWGIIRFICGNQAEGMNKLCVQPGEYL